MPGQKNCLIKRRKLRGVRKVVGRGLRTVRKEGVGGVWSFGASKGKGALGGGTRVTLRSGTSNRYSSRLAGTASEGNEREKVKLHPAKKET